MISQQTKIDRSFSSKAKAFIIREVVELLSYKKFSLSVDELRTKEGEGLCAYLDTEAMTRVEYFSLEVARE